MRDHLASLARQTGVVPEQLLPVPCAREIKYLWSYFCEMSRRRAPGERLSYAEVEAWARLKGVRLSPFEVEALDAIECIYLSFSTKAPKK